MKQHLLSSIILVLTTLILFSCKQEKSEESKIAFIKRMKCILKMAAHFNSETVYQSLFSYPACRERYSKMDPPLNEAGKLQGYKTYPNA